MIVSLLCCYGRSNPDPRCPFGFSLPEAAAAYGPETKSMILLYEPSLRLQLIKPKTARMDTRAHAASNPGAKVKIIDKLTQSPMIYVN
jgi:hypothetical protein